MKTAVRFIALVLLMLHLSVSAKAYPSIFGRDSTVWYVFQDDYHGNIPYYPPTLTYTIRTNVDTLWGNARYKKLFVRSNVATTSPIGRFGIREDTSAGKVWMRCFSCVDTTEVLLMDFTMQVGDTFFRERNRNPYHSIIADSVYYDFQGRKHIRFGGQRVYTTMTGAGQPVEFISGLGNTWGFRYVYEFLLTSKDVGVTCIYKDGERAYKDTALAYGNGCTYPLAVTEASALNNSATLYPNPCAAMLHITLPPTGATGAVIYNAFGAVVWRSNALSSSFLQIITAQWPAGLYMLRLSNVTGITSTYSFLKE